MEHFERELRKAMARREPSRDFTERVLAAAKASEQTVRPRFAWFSSVWAWRLVPVFAMLAVVLGMAAYQRHERVMRGEQAKQQVMLAVHIAGSKLSDMQTRIREVEQ